MAQPSITSSDSFQTRLLRSELWRASLVGAIWMVALCSALVRRALGAALMSIDSIFYSAIALMVFAVAFQVVVVLDTLSRLRRGEQKPASRWMVSAVVDVAIPFALLLILMNYSVGGAYFALSSPVILALPLVTMLSILRLKPWVSFWTGAVGGLVHWALLANAARRSEIDPPYVPEMLMYGTILILTGIAAAAISRQVRAYLSEAVDEAVAAEHAQRALVTIEHDLDVARDIQQGLMPSTPPSVPGFDIAGMARPAQQTGGDYYDWQKLPDGRLVVALADVTGHGIGPALVMAVCRAYARASAPSAIDSAALLSRINSLIYEDLAPTGRFITMAIAIVSPDASVELASAGHGPTLLYRARTRSVEWFGGDGVPLGIEAEEHFAPHRTLYLEPGDVLLLATDGFMEWPRHGDSEQFGLQRLQATLREIAAGSAKQILDQLDAAVQTFACGRPQVDDTTAVAIKRI